MLSAGLLEYALRRLLGQKAPPTLRISVADEVTTREWVGVRVFRAAVMEISELWSRMSVTPERELPHNRSRHELLPDIAGSVVLAMALRG